MPKQTRTRPASAAQVRAYVGKAEEYLSAATSELDADRPVAATSLAIHPDIVTKVIGRLSVQAGLPRLAPHGLRHAFAGEIP